MRTSQIVIIVLILIAAAGLINWARADETFHIATVFPLLGGYPPGFYDLAGIALIVYAAYRVGRMGGRDAGRRDARPSWEEAEEDDSQ